MSTVCHVTFTVSLGMNPVLLAHASTVPFLGRGHGPAMRWAMLAESFYTATAPKSCSVGAARDDLLKHDTFLKYEVFCELL